MNKLNALLIAIVATASMAFAQTASTSGVSGTATEVTAAVYQDSVSYGVPVGLGNSSNVYSASFGVSGTQTVSVSFSAQPIVSETNGEDANGNGSVSGKTTVQGGLLDPNGNTAGAWAKGSTSSQGEVNVNSSPNQAPYWATDYLGGSGSLSTGTSALIGTFTVAANGLSPVNGAFATAATTGSYNFSASNYGWMGSGSTSQNSCSQVFNLGNGFSATSSSSVTSVACPVGTK